MAEELPVIEAVGFSLKHAGLGGGGRWFLQEITLAVRPGRILAVIGPAGSGKSTFLKSIDRLCELEFPVQTEGVLKVQGQDVYDPKTDVLALRRKVGMVFSRPSLPVPGIFDNVALAPRMMGIHDKAVLAQIVERSLRQVGMWETLGNRLSENANTLALEAQQRLCIARVLAAEPVALLF
ncbi:MAG: ATP-binding cassette domain-containing protein, partial [Phycisphaerae bacterium]